MPTSLKKLQIHCNKLHSGTVHVLQLYTTCIITRSINHAHVYQSTSLYTEQHLRVCEYSLFTVAWTVDCNECYAACHTCIYTINSQPQITSIYTETNHGKCIIPSLPAPKNIKLHRIKNVIFLPVLLSLYNRKSMFFAVYKMF